MRFFTARVFKHLLTVDEHIAGILPVYSGQMTDDRAFAGSVRADKAVNRSVGHGHVQPVERAEAVKLLDDVSYLNHFSALLSGAAKASLCNSDVVKLRNKLVEFSEKLGTGAEPRPRHSSRQSFLFRGRNRCIPRLQARDTRAGSCSGLWQVLSPSRAQSLSYCLPAKLRKRSGDAPSLICSYIGRGSRKFMLITFDPSMQLCGLFSYT